VSGEVLGTMRANLMAGGSPEPATAGDIIVAHGESHGEKGGVFRKPRQGRQNHAGMTRIFLSPLPWLTRYSGRDPTAFAVGHIMSPLMRLRAMRTHQVSAYDPGCWVLGKRGSADDGLKFSAAPCLLTLSAFQDVSETKGVIGLA